MVKQGRQVGFQMPRLQCNQYQFFVLCKWIKTTESRHTGRSSPDEPRLEKLWLLSANFGGDKAERRPVMEGCGPAEQLGPPKPSAEQMSTFYKATRHKKHSEECPLHFILPASLFYIEAPKPGDSSQQQP